MRKQWILFISSILFGITVMSSVVAAYADHNVNINTATVNKLKTISEIGTVHAERIVEYRENERLFKTVDDLLNVKGIGKETVEKFREHITVDEKS